MKKRLLVTGALLGLLAMPAFADTVQHTFKKDGKTILVTITYTDFNHDGRIDTLQELRSITNIQVTVT